MILVLIDWPEFWAIFSASFILEDLATLSAALLYTEGSVNFVTAFSSIVLGVFVGDVLLFALGHVRFLRKLVYRLLPRTRLRQARKILGNHLFKALIIARFTPGLRLPVYVAAGLFRFSFYRFLLSVLSLSLLWIVFVFAVFALTGDTGRTFLIENPWWRYVLAALVVLAIVFPWIRKIIAR
jgi:membrane protein DedA with SNARE-associated domain